MNIICPKEIEILTKAQNRSPKAVKAPHLITSKGSEIPQNFKIDPQSPPKSLNLPRGRDRKSAKLQN
ncbi:MAG: hypothetical protein IK139_08820, partial [Lachnospiraceae bacterium]|nr:hypothetical protein [Lachnospiraceae bacterium]